MSSERVLRASTGVLIGVSLFSAGAFAQQAGQEGQEEIKEVTITGSRVITDNLRSPTPITSVSVDEIAKTTPSDIPDALNKLPTILGGRTPRTQGNASTNNGGNVLSLRNFGAARTLVLLDGHRVPSSNQDGSVNVDILPQMLVSRVDIVTGGASAIYGSDAVAGVVNFVLDKKYTGFKIKADTGISKYGDAEEGQVAAAWGTELFGGRGHFEDVGALPCSGHGADQRAALRGGRTGLAARQATVRRVTPSSISPTRASSTAGCSATSIAEQPAPTTTIPSTSRAS